MNELNKIKKQEQISYEIINIFEYYKNTLSHNKLLYKALDDFKFELQDLIKNNIDFKISLDFFYIKNERTLIYFLYKKDDFDNSGLLKYDELSNFNISFLLKKSIDLKELFVRNQTLNLSFRYNDYDFEGSSFQYSFDIFDLSSSNIENIIKHMLFN